MKRFWILLCLLLLALPVFSNTVVGTVTRAQGTVFRQKKHSGKEIKKLFSGETFFDHKTEEELKTGDQLFHGDKIRTLEKSFAQVKLLGQTVFVLGPESSLVLDPLDLQLERGLLHSIIPHGNPDQVRVRTPHVSMGIRGTEFITKVSPEESIINLLEGSLSMEKDGEEKILSARNVMKVTHQIMNEATAIPEQVLLLLRKNSVIGDGKPEIPPPPPSMESQTVVEEPVLRKSVKPKTWQEILLENQNKRK